MRSFDRHIKNVLLLLLCGHALHAQDVSLQDWQKQVQPNLLPKEKLFVHSDKDFYIAGEIAWFKIYVTDAATNKPADLSKVAYVELISKDRRAIQQASIGVSRGVGDGSFLLPLSIQTGNYILRAYTNWMKNFSEEYFFEKHITIVNTQKKPDWKQLDAPDSFHVKFFPEGGNLVKDISSTIAFTVKDRYGKNVDANIAILNQAGDTLKKITQDEFRNGIFRFTPADTNAHSATVVVNNQRITVPFPRVYGKGFVMHLQNNNRSHLVSLQTNEDVNSTVYLLVHSRQSVKLALTQRIQNKQASFEIDKQLLDDGVSCITIFNEARQPVCERLIFKSPAISIHLNTGTDRTVYGLRSKVDFSLAGIDKNASKEILNMSASVILLDSLQQLPVDDIRKYCWLQSEMPGVDISAIDFDDHSAAAEEKIDHVLLTAGWRRYRWDEQFASAKPALKFLPEYEGHLVKATVVDKRTGKPAAGVAATLSAPGRMFVFRNAVSNAQGEIFFSAKDLYGHNEVIVQGNNAADSNYRFDIQKTYAELSGNTVFKNFYLPQSRQQLLQQYSLAVQAQQQYLQEERARFAFPIDVDTAAFYGVPDKRYLLDDYTRFITMEEVIREYVAEVRLRRSRDNFRYEVLNTPYKNFFDEPPLVLLDGVPVNNLNKIVAFDPLKVRKLDVVSRKFYYGQQAFNGIVSYNTYKGDLGGYQLDPGAVIVEYPGLQLQREFYAPVYETPEEKGSRLPDMRTVLMWIPGIESMVSDKTSISFFTGDIPGKYAIVVQGMSASGIPVSTTHYFEVKK